MPSDRFVADFSDYKDKAGSRVPPGRYRVMVADSELDTAKSGNQMVNLWLRIQGGEFDGMDIVDRLVLTPNSLFRVHGFLTAIGIKVPRKRLEFNLRQFANQILDIDVEDGDPYNGRVKSEVRGYLRVARANTEKPADLPTDLSGLEEFDPKTSSNPGSNGTGSVSVPDSSEEVDLDKLDLG